VVVLYLVTTNEAKLITEQSVIVSLTERSDSCIQLWNVTYNAPCGSSLAYASFNVMINTHAVNNVIDWLRTEFNSWKQRLEYFYSPARLQIILDPPCFLSNKHRGKSPGREWRSNVKLMHLRKRQVSPSCVRCLP